MGACQSMQKLLTEQQGMHVENWLQRPGIQSPRKDGDNYIHQSYSHLSFLNCQWRQWFIRASEQAWLLIHDYAYPLFLAAISRRKKPGSGPDLLPEAEPPDSTREGESR